MILDNFESLLNFSVNHIDLSNFITATNEVQAFEDAVSILNVDNLSSGCSHDDFYAETLKYERAVQASQLSAVAKNDINSRLWQKFIDYKSKYEQLATSFRKLKNSKDVLIIMIKTLKLFPETGSEIPCYSDIQDRLKVINGIDKKINELSIKSEILPNEIIEKFNKLKNNCNKCYAPWSGDFTGKGELKFDNGLYYSGDLVNGRVNGTGELFYLSERYERDNYYGGFIQGNCHGYGVLVYRNGDVYDGIFKDNYPDGKGKITYKNGDVYEGEFKEGKRHGYGKLTGKDPYEGQWKNDEKSPTPQQEAYWRGVKHFGRAEYKSALDCFNNAGGILKSAIYIKKCQEEIKQEARLLKIRKKQAFAAEHGQTVKNVLLTILGSVIAVGLIVAGWLLLSKFQHVGYVFWVVIVAATLHAALAGESRLAVRIPSQILLAALNIAMTIVCANQGQSGVAITVCVFTTIILIVLENLIPLWPDIDLDPLGLLTCSIRSWKIIFYFILVASTIAAYYFAGELVSYYMAKSTKGFWHALWIVPVIMVAFSLIQCTCILAIRGDMSDIDKGGGGVWLTFYVAMTLTVFIRALIAIVTVTFSAGIFFFLILLLIVAILAAGPSYGISHIAYEYDF